MARGLLRRAVGAVAGVSLLEDVENRGHVELVGGHVALLLGLVGGLELLQADGVVAGGRQGDELPHPGRVFFVDGKVGGTKITAVGLGAVDGFALQTQALTLDRGLAAVVGLGAGVGHLEGAVDGALAGKRLAEALLKRVLHAGITGSRLAGRLHGRGAGGSGALAEVGEIDLHFLVVIGGRASGAVGTRKVDERVDAGAVAIVGTAAAAVLGGSVLGADERGEGDGVAGRGWRGGGGLVPTGLSIRRRLVVGIAAPGWWRELVLGRQATVVLDVALQLQQLVLHEFELLAHRVVVRRQLVDLALEAVGALALLLQGGVKMGHLALVGFGLLAALVEGALQLAVRLLHLLRLALAEGALGLTVLLLALRRRVVGGRLAAGLGARRDDIAVAAGALVHGGRDVGRHAGAWSKSEGSGCVRRALGRRGSIGGGVGVERRTGAIGLRRRDGKGRGGIANARAGSWRDVEFLGRHHWLVVVDAMEVERKYDHLIRFFGGAAPAPETRRTRHCRGRHRPRIAPRPSGALGRAGEGSVSSREVRIVSRRLHSRGPLPLTAVSPVQPPCQAPGPLPIAR